MELSFPHIEAGSVIDPPGLVLLEEIGRGRSGWVYKGNNLQGDKQCAVKILVTEKKGLDKEALETELKNLIAIKDPGFPKYIGWYRWGNEKGYMYVVVMEYIDGEHFRKCDITPEVAKEMIERVIEYHDKGVVHKNIALHNFLRDKTGQIYLVDVGLEAYTPLFRSELRNEEELPPEITNGRVIPEKSKSIDAWLLGNTFEGSNISSNIVKSLKKPDINRRIGLPAASRMLNSL